MYCSPCAAVFGIAIGHLAQQSIAMGGRPSGHAGSNILGKGLVQSNSVAKRFLMVSAT
jgi:hypothetical protein